MSRLLYLVDAATARELDGHLVESGCEARRVATAVEALAAAAAEAFDVALVDPALAERPVADLVAELKRVAPDLEILLLAGAPSMATALDAVRLGAWGHVERPFDAALLRVKVQAAREKARMAREKRRLFEELVESQERYRLLFEASSDAIILYDAETRKITDANAAAARLYGYRREELLGLDAAQVGALDEELRREIELCTRGGHAVVVRRDDLRRDGSVCSVEVSAGSFPLRGRLTIVEVIRDVTERRRADETRRELEARLLQAQKMDALGRLASGVAHDFNNLLCVILNCANFILEDLPGFRAGDRTAEDVQSIIRAGQSAVGLTRQLLAFSRKQIVTPEVLDVNQVVGDLEKLLKRTIGEDIRLVTRLSPEVRRVKMGRGHLEQVIANLAVNARDAMVGGGRLTVTTENILADELGGSGVLLTVADTGCGMSEEVLEKIFEPFFTTKGAGKGTGLGLATVYGIVEQAGGRVTVSSQVGEGTTFRILLPATDEREEALQPLAPSLRGRGETVMIVEDDPEVRGVIERMLHLGGYVAIPAASGEEALALCADHGGPIDVLLTDVVMPEMSGRDVASALQALRPSLRPIFMSGHASEAVVQRGIGEGQRFLPKPFRADQLFAAIQEALKERGVELTLDDARLA